MHRLPFTYSRMIRNERITARFVIHFELSGCALISASSTGRQLFCRSLEKYLTKGAGPRLQIRRSLTSRIALVHFVALFSVTRTNFPQSAEREHRQSVRARQLHLAAAPTIYKDFSFSRILLKEVLSKRYVHTHIFIILYIFIYMESKKECNSA